MIELSERVRELEAEVASLKSRAERAEAVVAELRADRAQMVVEFEQSRRDLIEAIRNVRCADCAAGVEYCSKRQAHKHMAVSQHFAGNHFWKDCTAKELRALSLLCQPTETGTLK